MLKKIAVLAVMLAVAFAVLMLTARSARFVIASETVVDRPAADVWEVLAAVSEWSAWWPGMRAARLSPGWQEGADLFLLLQGNPERMPAKIDLYEPPREIAWARLGVLKSTTRTRWRLHPQPTGTVIHLEHSIEGPQAILARITGRTEFEKYQQAVLASLRHRLQSPASPPASPTESDRL